MLKILTQEEKINSKKLWLEIFAEDSKSFVDYYYNIKTKDNQILAKLIDEKIVSMLHLNPYLVNFNGAKIKSYYIVGVATLIEHRKKGYMRELISESLNLMHKENIPFSFLMPAKEEIYLPFDFNYIYDKEFLELKTAEKELEKHPVKNSDYKEIADFLNSKLKKEYNVFCVRDEGYIKNLHLELKSEKGDILKLFSKDKLVGYYLYWGSEKSETRSVYALKDYCYVIKKEPKIMARIVNLNSFFENIFLKDLAKEKTFHLKIKDNFIKENNSTFKWTVSAKSSSFKRCENELLDSLIEIEIKSLTSLMFGYKSLESLINSGEIVCKDKIVLADLSLIDFPDKIFLDEIV